MAGLVSVSFISVMHRPLHWTPELRRELRKAGSFVLLPEENGYS